VTEDKEVMMTMYYIGKNMAWLLKCIAFGKKNGLVHPDNEKVQMLCILSALLGCQGMGEFQNMLHAALNMGVDPVAVKEVLYQAAAYLGIGRMYDFLVAAIRIMEQHGVELPLPGQAFVVLAARYKADTENSQINL